MGIIIDVLIILIMFACVFHGYKKGLVNVIVSLLAIIISLIITFLCYRPISNLIIKNTQVDESIYNTIYNNIKDIDFNKKDDSNIIVKYAQNYMEDYSQQAKDTINKYVAENITYTIINGLVFILVFIMIKIILILLKAVFGFISNLPIIKQFNKSGGIIYGVIEGIVALYVIFAIAYISVPLFNNHNITKAIDESFIGKTLYYDNIIIKVVKI